VRRAYLHLPSLEKLGNEHEMVRIRPGRIAEV